MMCDRWTDKQVYIERLAWANGLCLLGPCANHDPRLGCDNVKTTFLNSDLEEEIYMVQPDECVLLGQENKIYTKSQSSSLDYIKQSDKIFERWTCDRDKGGGVPSDVKTNIKGKRRLIKSFVSIS
ncbi:Uncharacterized protein TCM_008163 [Theobroma cacao]|uniref:Uncharacterized protein n=1 Tax=Theobroma cacao TaxID=3641 RepID=A0A061EB16_THECC|nr:Uncharacterized protein TCM_008163 [Theobroma cacao]